VSANVNRHRVAEVRIAIVIAATVLANSVGNLLLSIGMKRVGEVSSVAPAALAAALVRTVTAGTIWMGVGALIIFLILHLVLLSWADYSYVQPASAAGYALAPLLGYAISGEPVSSARWTGVLLITIGVGLIGRTPARTNSPLPPCEPSSV
jgi:uncharacterized membrane protein